MAPTANRPKAVSLSTLNLRLGRYQIHVPPKELKDKRLKPGQESLSRHKNKTPLPESHTQPGAVRLQTSAFRRPRESWRQSRQLAGVETSHWQLAMSQARNASLGHLVSAAGRGWARSKVYQVAKSPASTHLRNIAKRA